VIDRRTVWEPSMSRKIIAAMAVCGGTAFAMLAGPRGPLGGWWRPIPMQQPTGGQTSALLTSGVIEAIGFGAAIAVLVVGRPVIARFASTPARTTLVWLSASWLLGSWWPHTALHQHFGVKPSALAPIELVFHAGSIIMFALFLGALIAVRPRATARATEPARSEHRPTGEL
jgi:hypothetical protein